MTPACSTCGYVVELMRSCFTSEFRLFRGSDVVTPGRWVWAPEDTPAYPGWHWLGSRDWVRQDWLNWPPLGELQHHRRKWSDGRPPVVFPPAEQLGDSACIRDGERPGSVSLGLVDGFDAGCWLLSAAPPPPVNLLVDISAREHIRSLAEALAWIYVRPDEALAKLLTFLGPGSSGVVVPNSVSLYPGSVIGIQGTATVVLISGTANPQQMSVQAMQGITGPAGRGLVGTNPLWWEASTAVLNRLSASGASPDGPITVVGHSYGGATATLVAYRLSLLYPNRVVQLLTFGSPRPGDVRLQRRLVRVRVRAIENAGDPVPAIPPAGGVLQALAWLVPGGVTAAWSDWVSLPGRVGLSEGGVFDFSPDLLDVLASVREITVKVLAGQPVPQFVAHEMHEYARRLGIVLPEVPEVLPGTILAWGAASTPAGYLNCDGSAVSRTVYGDLFSTLGTTWGVGDGSTTFNLPDLRGRTVIGDGTGPGLTPRVVADSGGKESHEITVPQLAEHDHQVDTKDKWFAAGGDDFAHELFNAGEGEDQWTTTAAGEDQSTPTMPPYKVARWIIKT